MDLRSHEKGLHLNVGILSSCFRRLAYFRFEGANSSLVDPLAPFQNEITICQFESGFLRIFVCGVSFLYVIFLLMLPPF